MSAPYMYRQFASQNDNFHRCQVTVINKVVSNQLPIDFIRKVASQYELDRRQMKDYVKLSCPPKQQSTRQASVFQSNAKYKTSCNLKKSLCCNIIHNAKSRLRRYKSQQEFLSVAFPYKNCHVDFDEEINLAQATKNFQQCIRL